MADMSSENEGFYSVWNTALSSVVQPYFNAKNLRLLAVEQKNRG
jgi:hypothetical protein